MTTSLDEELTELISPLVPLNPRLAVSPHVNTLCLAYHYHLARRKYRALDNRIKLIDWNLDYRDPQFFPTLMGNDLTGLYMFYSSKDIADDLKKPNPKQKPGGAGFFNSFAVTRYRQRYVFLRRTTSNEAFIRNHERSPINEVATELLTDRMSRRKPFIITDIRGQAQAVARTVTNQKKLPPIVYPGSLIGDEISPDDHLALFVYSGPSTEYMARQHKHFIKLDIDELPTLQDDAYETHIIWHMPPPSRSKPDDNITIIRCLRAYHSRLFEAALTAKDAEFEGIGSAISLTLTARHPSFSTVVFESPADVKQCLLDHHSDPPPHYLG